MILARVMYMARDATQRKMSVKNTATFFMFFRSISMSRVLCSSAPLLAPTTPYGAMRAAITFMVLSSAAGRASFTLNATTL